MLNTISKLLQHASEQLTPTSDSVRLDSEILLAFVLNENRSYLYTWPEKEITTEQIEHFNALVKRRSYGEPIAYIVGEQEFWSMPLKVTPNTLIPRPETELLVELALQKIAAGSNKRILDLGTGSGAIALAIAKERPSCEVTGTDRSKQALCIAQENALHLNIKNATFSPGHWFKEITSEKYFDIIVSNPPYIACHDPHLSQGDVRFEPDSALTSGADGLDDIHEIAEQARQHLKADGWLLMEHGYNQGTAIIARLISLGYRNIIDHKDLADLPRVITAQYS